MTKSFEVRSHYSIFNPPQKKNNLEVLRRAKLHEKKKIRILLGGGSEGEVKTKVVCRRKSQKLIVSKLLTRIVGRNTLSQETMNN